MTRFNQKGIAHLLFIMLFAALLVGVGYIVLRAVKKQPLVELANNQEPALVFSQPMFDVNQIDWIGPLGELNGGYEEAQTIAGVVINIKPEAVAGGQEIEIKAPTDMTLEQYGHFMQPIDNIPGWSLHFKLNENVTMRVDHITRVTEQVMAATTNTPKADSRTEPPKKKINIKAGEVFAYTFGTLQAHNWNIYVYDKTHINKFVNQARYVNDRTGQSLVNATCPFDYYEETTKAGFMALMGQSRAREAKVCGEVSRDVAGALAGMWHFSPDAGSGMQIDKDGHYETPLSIYKNAAGVVSINQIDGKRIDINPNTKTYKDPATVTGEHCYEGQDASLRVGGYAFFKVSGDQLQLASSPSGGCPASFPAGTAKTYYR